MKILISAPSSPVSLSGNWNTATQWAAFLRYEGHTVEVGQKPSAGDIDLLIALHAEKSHDTVREFRSNHPTSPVLLALTGTDLYPKLSPTSLETMELADGLIVLQRKALAVIPTGFTEKVSVVIQSAPQREEATGPCHDPDHFDVCVVGHLREVKDPLLTAKATQLLPSISKIRVRHAGGIIEPEYHDLVSEAERSNPRYRWLGELNQEETAELIASSRLLILSSHHEGGARVIGEAISLGTPVLASRIDGVTGLVGDTYPGLFPVGDAATLATLLQRCEERGTFYESLLQATGDLRAQFEPATEAAALRCAIEQTLRDSGRRQK